MSTPSSADVFSAMQSGTPYRTFKKAILGKVYITYLDPFSGEPEDMIMEGNPAKNDEGCFYHAWSEKEYMFFKNMNKVHLKDGNLIEQKPKPMKEKPKETAELNYNALPDEEIKKILRKPFLALQNALNKMTSEAAVYRILRAGEEMNKSEKFMKAIRARLSEVQGLPTEEEDTEAEAE